MLGIGFFSRGNQLCPSLGWNIMGTQLPGDLSSSSDQMEPEYTHLSRGYITQPLTECGQTML